MCSVELEGVEKRFRRTYENRFYANRSMARKKQIRTKTFKPPSSPDITMSLLDHTLDTSMPIGMSHQQHEDEGTGMSPYQRVVMIYASMSGSPMFGKWHCNLQSLRYRKHLPVLPNLWAVNLQFSIHRPPFLLQIFLYASIQLLHILVLEICRYQRNGLGGSIIQKYQQSLI
jgi:hypothetical protein